MNTRRDEIDLREIFYVIKKRLLIIIAVSMVFGIASGLYSYKYITPLYSSSAKIYVLSKADAVLSMQDLNLSSGLTSDYIEMIKSRTVLQPVIDNLQLNMKYETLNGLVSVANPKDTRILYIQVIFDDPAMAKKINNEIVEQSKKCIKKIISTNEVNVLEEAFSSGIKISPNNKKNAIIGAMVGVFITCGAFVMQSLLSNKVKTADDIERYLGLNTLGMVLDKKEERKINKKRKKKKKSLKKGNLEFN